MRTTLPEQDVRQTPISDGHEHPPQLIVVCALTYRRPVMLRHLLAGLAALEHPGSRYGVHVIVIDNDYQESARAIVADVVAAGFPWQLTYEVEAQRGIAHGRNRALVSALEMHADHLAFIDDDSTPEAAWLKELLRMSCHSGAPIVQGRVRYEFTETPPGWLEHAGTFSEAGHLSGTYLDCCYTNNVLISTSILRTGLAFPSGFDLRGGSDVYFFDEAHRRGHSIVFSAEAIVVEMVPPERLRFRWSVRRYYRYGNHWGLDITTDNNCPPGRVLYEVALLGRSFVHGIGLLAASPLLRGGAAVRGALHLAHAAGRLTGMAGVAYQPYRRIDGF